MARYIDAEKLCDSLRESYNRLFEIYKKSKDNDVATICEGQLNTFMECIIRANTQPTADVVEMKHGEWILEYGTYGKMICSECKNEAPITNKRDNSLQLQTLYLDSPYCHHCGAKMDGRRGT